MLFWVMACRERERGKGVRVMRLRKRFAIIMEGGLPHVTGIIYLPSCGMSQQRNIVILKERPLGRDP